MADDQKVDLCKSGRKQSPININTQNLGAPCIAKCDLMFYYRSSSCNVTNDLNKSIILDYDPGSYVLYNTVVYELDRISIGKSAHTIDNTSFHLELNLHHKNLETNEPLIIAVFIEKNDAASASSYFFDLFGKSIPRISGDQKHINTPENWNIYSALPEMKSFYKYEGSLIREPCTENVIWIVLENPVNCSTNFFEKIKKRLTNWDKSVRPIQNSKDIVVNYNPNSNSKNVRNYGDKLRCYTEKEFRQSCAKLTSRKDIVNAKHDYYMKLLTSGSLFVLTLLFLFYLIQNDFFSKTADKIKRFTNKNIFLENPNNRY